MKISIEHLSRLARLTLTDDEKVLFGNQINNILTYMEKLDELDTEHAQPTSHVIEIKNVVREDRPWKALSRDEALMNAPDHTEKYYRVPKIIE